MASWPVALIVLFPAALWAYEVAQSVEDKLAANEANYYAVDATGLLVVALISDEGDADMYASTTTREPSSEDSEFSSTSCGLDLMVVPPADRTKAARSRRVNIGVVSQGWHQQTHYRLFIIAPSADDIKKYQVWDWEPESGQQVLLVDYDPLQIANDPDLHRLLGQLMAGGVRSSEHTQPVLVTVVEWAWFLFLKGLEIGVEVLL